MATSDDSDKIAALQARMAAKATTRNGLIKISVAEPQIIYAALIAALTDIGSQYPDIEAKKKSLFGPRHLVRVYYIILKHMPHAAHA